MKKYLLVLFSIFSLGIDAQVTLRITSIPANTPTGATIYLAGSINGWNPFDNGSIERY